MRDLVEIEEWWRLMHRVQSDPAKFIERAAWHLWMAERFVYLDAATALLISAKYMRSGQEIPEWLFK